MILAINECKNIEETSKEFERWRWGTQFFYIVSAQDITWKSQIISLKVMSNNEVSSTIRLLILSKMT